MEQYLHLVQVTENAVPTPSLWKLTCLEKGLAREFFQCSYVVSVPTASSLRSYSASASQLFQTLLSSVPKINQGKLASMLIYSTKSNFILTTKGMNSKIAPSSLIHPTVAPTAAVHICTMTSYEYSSQCP